MTLPDSRAVPLTQQQLAVYLDQALVENVGAYTIGGFYTCAVDLCPQRLNDALRQVVARNDALRVVIHDGEDGPAQSFVPTPAAAQLLTVHDLSAAGDAAAVAHLNTLFAQGIPLSDGGPLYRFHMARGATRCYWSFAFHHVVIDTPGLALFAREVDTLYNGASLPEPISYLHAVEDDSLYRDSPARQDDLTFWRAAVRPGPPLFPATGPAAEGRGGIVTLDLPSGLLDRLEGRARGRSLSLLHVLAAAFAALLARTHDRADVTLGIALAKRRGARAKRTIGLFSGVVPLTVAVDPATSFADLTAAIAASLRRCYRHQRLSITDIHRAVGEPSTRLYDVAISQVALNFDAQFGSTPSVVEAFAVAAEPLPVNVQLRNYHPGADVRLDVQYNRAHLSPADAAALARRAAHVLAVIEEQPDAPLHTLELLPPEEVATLAALGDGGAAPEVREDIATTIAAQAAPQAITAPGAVAVVQDDGTRWTYAHLSAAAAATAAALAEAGVQPGQPVVVCTQRTPAAIAALLGAWQAGAVYVPADPALPDARLAFMAGDCGAAAVLCDDALAPRLSALGLPVVRVAGPDGRMAQTTPPAPQQPETAYIIYTSGSTGTPKGVRVGHTALARHIAAMRGVYGLTAADTVLQFASFSFDASLEVMLAALSCGGRVVLRGDAVWTAEDLDAVVVRHGISVVNLPPAYLAQWVRAWPDLPSRTPARAGTPLRLVISGGDVLDPATAATVAGAGVRLLNAYGPTEATITATVHDITPSPPGQAAPGQAVPIGRPLPGRHLILRDSRGRAVPRGATGELCIGGPLLAEGYEGRNALTAERFVRAPDGGRLYRTGDLCRWRDDGGLDYLGRLDDQVKVSGHRIELGEIEAAARALPDVAEAAAVVVAGETVTLHVVAAAEATPDAAALRAALAGRLPPYMVPTGVIVRRDFLPLTTSGKIDRRALSDTASAPNDAPNDATEMAETRPLSQAETILRDLWNDILDRPQGAPPIGLTDTFFALGGHSLSGLRLLSRIRAEFGEALGLRALFDHPTLADLATLLPEEVGEIEDLPAATNTTGAQATSARATATARQVA